MKRSFAFFLALTMLAASAGVTFATHYCGNHAVKTAISLGMHELTCDMPTGYAVCKQHDRHETTRDKGCCENKYRHLKLSDAFKTTEKLETSFTTPFVLSYLLSYLPYFIRDIAIATTPLSDPPLPDAGFLVLIQCFRL